MATLARLYAKRSVEEIAVILGRGIPAVYRKASSLSLDKRTGKRRKTIISRRVLTAEEDAILRELYPNTAAAVIAKRFKTSLWVVYRAAHQRGLKRSEESKAKEVSELVRNSPRYAGSRACQFRPGLIPKNKGTRRPGFAPGRMAETQFPKGNRPANWKPVGTIRKNSDGYWEIKVREGIYNAEQGRPWQLLNRELWRRAHGPIPRGHVVAFKDHNLDNCVIENLELITQRANRLRNSMWQMLPRELAEVMQLNGQLKRRLRGKE